MADISESAIRPSDAGAPEHRVIAFGIPSLDRLIGRTPHAPNDASQFGYALSDRSNADVPDELRKESATFCIIGPDGTGKSLFALHLASEYWRRTRTAVERPRIVYASSDLSFERAQRVWHSFWLDRPASRRLRLPFEADSRVHYRGDGGPISAAARAAERQRRLPLQLYAPSLEYRDISAYLTGASEHDQEVAFLDLESTTSGDDWTFLHSMIAILQEPAASEPRHLLLIDAVEGLETLVGERDAFGQEQSRRARIAQIVRAASRKCHLVFVVEEPKDGERMPEVFVSDLVVRLRSSIDRDYARRTVELEKVRGQRHIRGQHDFRIRQSGSRTGQDYNPDDPCVGTVGDEMAYIQVFPSLHYLTHDAARSTGLRQASDEQRWTYAAFGIYQLDSMLLQTRATEFDPLDTEGEPDRFDLKNAKIQQALEYQQGRAPAFLRGRQRGELREIWRELSGTCGTAQHPPRAGYDKMGLRIGSVVSLIGKDSTYKSQLARAFLSQSFRMRHVLGSDVTDLPAAAVNSRDPLLGQGVSVLLATYDICRERLAEKLTPHLIGCSRNDRRGRRMQDAGLRERLIVRRLEPHHLPSAVLVHVIEQLIDEAKQRLYGLFPDATPQARAALHGRIRFVIDDWSTLLSTFPEVRRDPLVLPYLADYLRHEGVTTVIIATQFGDASDREPGFLQQELRELRVMADFHLNTWHVPFFDEQRVAISAEPSPIPGAGVQVRELRRGRNSELPQLRLSQDAPAATASERAWIEWNDRFDEEALVVDPHFELYSGLQEGRPTPVPLEVRLYAESEDVAAFQAYLVEMRELFGHLFGQPAQRDVLRPQYGKAYDMLRELSYLQSEARLDHTLVLQVDEFWAESRSELLRQDRYLFARTAEPIHADEGRAPLPNPPFLPVRTEDPFGLFFVSDALVERQRRRRARFRKVLAPFRRFEFFDLVGYDLPRAAKRYPIDKVPYTWDFGLLICNRLAWQQVFDHHDARTQRMTNDGPVAQTIREIWYRLWKIDHSLDVVWSILPTQSGAETQFAPAPFAHWAEVKRTGNQVQQVVEWTSYRPVHRSVNLPDTWEEVKHEQKHPQPVSWREFLGACVTVAERSQGNFIPFDVDLLATESFPCLVLEIWFSELFQAVELSGNDLYRKRLEEHRYWPRAQRDAIRSVSLKEMLGDPEFGPLFRRALYRTFLLLDESMAPSNLNAPQLNLVPRSAHPGAVAARHWYSTASIAMRGAAESRGQIVVGMPGHFTTRGDWFLAMAKGSRSPRLGERAIDILCSRRGNIARLQAGIGLPVRDTFAPDEFSDGQLRTEYWTSLPFVGDDHLETRIPYAELRRLGAFDEGDHMGRAGNFFWLWRSTIESYDVHCRMWQRWLVMLFQKWRTWQPTATSPNPHDNPTDQQTEMRRGGFAEYDHYLRKDHAREASEPCFVDTRQNPRWTEFDRFCNSLIEGLCRAGSPANRPPLRV